MTHAQRAVWDAVRRGIQDRRRIGKASGLSPAQLRPVISSLLFCGRLVSVRGTLVAL